MEGIGFSHGMFNVEFMFDGATDAIRIIEINPRMASQFADLHEKVDGRNTYSLLLDLALGRRPPAWQSGRGRHAVAVSHVLRRFDDALVAKVPSQHQIDKVLQRHPDLRVEVLATEGELLSRELQDGRSYRYGIISVGGRDLQEIGEIIAWCCVALPFEFAKVSRPAWQPKQIARCG